MTFVKKHSKDLTALVTLLMLRKRKKRKVKVKIQMKNSTGMIQKRAMIRRVTSYFSTKTGGQLRTVNRYLIAMETEATSS